MTSQHGTHNDLHSEQGALPGEHPGRATNPVIKVRDLAWLEFVKPDLAASERFAHAFGFTTVSRTADELPLRGTDAGAPGRDRPARTTLALPRRGLPGRGLRRRGSAGRRHRVEGRDAAGAPGRTHRRPDRPQRGHGAGGRRHPRARGAYPQPTQAFNLGHEVVRANATQRPPRAPAMIQRLGHVVLQSTRYLETLNWYLQHLGLIVSDFKYYQGQRERGPTMSFIRCDRGSTPTDHHTLAMMLGPGNRYVHSAYQVADLDALAAGGEYLREAGFQRSWGIGRHIEGSQIFDYWRDPDGLLVEHYADGDLFDSTLEPGWSPMTASGLAQWGPPVTKDFLGLTPGRDLAHELVSMARSLRERQRVRPDPPARPAESDQLMSTTILRTRRRLVGQHPRRRRPHRHRRHDHRRAARRARADRGCPRERHDRRPGHPRPGRRR